MPKFEVHRTRKMNMVIEVEAQDADVAEDKAFDLPIDDWDITDEDDDTTDVIEIDEPDEIPNEDDD